MAAAARTPAHRRRRIGHLSGLTLFLLLLGLWLVAGAMRPALLDRDWVAFDNAGWRAMSGDWSRAYAASATERWPFLYPPLGLVLALPLGLLPYFPSYVACVALALAGIAWSCRLLKPLGGAEPGRHEVFCTVVLCVPTTLQVLITGQWSWVYVVSLSGLAAHWARGDERTAGRYLALMALKPNIAVFVLPLLLVRRRWDTLRSAAIAGVLAVGVTAPLALGAWPGFLAAVRDVAARQGQGDAPIEKQTTILSFVHVVTGGDAGSVAPWAAWLVIAVLLGVHVLRAWRMAGPEATDLRLVGMVALAVVALSPRLYFYDGLVAVLPAAHWYLCRGAYASRSLRRMEGGCIAAIVVVTFLFFPYPAVATAFGPLAGLWLALEAIDVRTSARRSAATRPHGDVGAELVLAG